MRPTLLVVPFVAVAVAPLRAQTPQFTPLDIPESGYFAPNAVSADGNTVVGMAYILGQGDKARRWRNGLGFDYPGPSSGPVANWASGVSSSGSVVTGGTGHAVFGDLEGWVRNGASVGHVGSPSGHDTSDCRGVSFDGLVVVGYGGSQANPNLFEAAKYTDQGGWTNLGFLPGDNDSKALGANQNGSVIVGWSAGSSSPRTGFRWTAASGMQAIPHLSGGNEAYAESTNAAGDVVVGGDYVGNAQTAWRWSASTGTVELAPLPGCDQCWATCISPDGSIVGGWSSSPIAGLIACLWDAQGNAYDLRDLLAHQGLGATLATWSLIDVTDIAGSGPWAIVGEGSEPTGQYGGWVVRLDVAPAPEPGAPFCFGDDGGTPCPCSNPSATSSGGCVSSLGVGGALAASGVASVGNDTLVLRGSAMPNSTALYLQGTAQENGGAGSVLGDGLLCVGGSLVRLGSKINAGGASQYPLPGDALVSVRGGVSAGQTHSYQIWYRNAASWCTGATFNLTNGYELVWAP